MSENKGVDFEYDIKEIKSLLQECLKKHGFRHRAWLLAEKYNLVDFYTAQCKRYSLDPDYIKVKKMGGYASTLFCKDVDQNLLKFQEKLYFYLKKEIDRERQEKTIESVKFLVSRNEKMKK